MSSDAHYLKKELYDLMKTDPSIFEFFQNGSLDGIWYWDLENTENEWMSPEFWTTLGYDPDKKKYLASEWQEIIHPEDLRIAIENFRKHCENPQHPYDQIVRYRHKNGSTVWVRCRGMAIRDEKGKPVRMLGAHNDLTHLKKAEEAVIKERDYAHKILNTVDTIIVTLDKTGRITLINRKGCRLLGYEKDELIGRNWFSTVLQQPDATIHVYPLFLKLIAGEMEVAEYVENSVVTRKGEVRQIAWHNALMHDEDGKVVGTLSSGEDITARKAAEASLVESEARHRSVLETINEGVILQSASGEILTWNRGAEDAFGISADEVIGQKSESKDWAIIRKDGSKYESKDHPSMKTLRTGKPCRNEIIGVYQPSGELRWLSVNTNPVYQEGYADPSAVAISFSDITEMRNKEAELLHLAQRLEEVQKFAKIGSWWYDPVTRQSTWTDEMFRILGLEIQPEAIPYEEHKKIIHPDDWEFFDAAVHRALREGVGYDLELRITHQSGEIRYVNSKCYAEKDGGNGKVKKLFGVTQDITDRKKSELQIRSLERRNQALLDHSPVCHKIVDLDFKLRYMSANGFNMLKLDPKADVYGEPYPFHFFPETFKRDMIKKLTEVKETGESRTLEGLTNDVEGNQVWLDSSLIPVFDNNNEIEYITVVSNDTTSRKKHEAEKAALTDQLRQAQKMEALGRLAGGVAHDFNNMLGIILGNTEMLLEDLKPSQPFYDPLQEIENAAVRSTDVVRQLLTFARKQTIAPKCLNLNATVDSMIKMLRRLLGENIELVWKPGTEIWSVKIDPAQVDQILANLTVNARDAIQDVGKLLIKTCNVVLDKPYGAKDPDFIPGEFVLLSVSDDGCGMDEETRKEVFTPFYSTKQVGKGTGLGLATVYGIVKQNNGVINVYSEPGHGTTFRIYFPRFIADKNVDTAVFEQKAPPVKGTETILLVEDEPAILKMTQKMLERKGYRVFSATTPAEAIEVAEKYASEIDLLLTDVVMPGMNGRDLAQQINASYPGIRVLFMSGYAADVINHHGILNASHAFIQKPFSTADLAEKLRGILETGPR